MGKHKSKQKKHIRFEMDDGAAVTHSNSKSGTGNSKTSPYGEAAKDFWAEFEQNSTSPAASCTLGDEDTETMFSNVQTPKKDSAVTHNQQDEFVAPWVNQFKDNRDKGMKLLDFDEESSGDVVELDIDLVDDVEESLGFCLVGYFAGKFPGKAAVLQLCDSWKVSYEYFAHGKGWLVFKFFKDADRLKVLHGGPYNVYGRLLILKIMPRFFRFDDKDFSKIPIWIQFPGLPIELWNKECLSRIAKKIGKPLSTDELTVTKKQLTFARALVEVDAAKELPDSIIIKMSDGTSFEQDVRFENLPKFCSICCMFGHNLDGCPLNKLTPKSATDPLQEAAALGSDETTIKEAGIPESKPAGIPENVQDLQSTAAPPVKTPGMQTNTMENMANVPLINVDTEALGLQPMSKVVERATKSKKRDKKKGKHGENIPMQSPT